MRRDELRRLSRDELVELATNHGVQRPAVLTKAELIDELLKRLAPGSSRSRGWLGRARDLLAAVVELGLHLPETARLLRGEPAPMSSRRPPPPLPTVTLAEIYSAQGHTKKALKVLDEVLAQDPSNAEASELYQKLGGTKSKPKKKRATKKGTAQASPAADSSAAEAATATPAESTAAESTAAESTAAESIAAESTAAESTLAESIAAESTAADEATLSASASEQNAAEQAPTGQEPAAPTAEAADSAPAQEMKEEAPAAEAAASTPAPSLNEEDAAATIPSSARADDSAPEPNQQQEAPADVAPAAEAAASTAAPSLNEEEPAATIPSSARTEDSAPQSPEEQAPPAVASEPAETTPLPRSGMRQSDNVPGSEAASGTTDSAGIDPSLEPALERSEEIALPAARGAAVSGQFPIGALEYDEALLSGEDIDSLAGLEGATEVEDVFPELSENDELIDSEPATRPVDLLPPPADAPPPIAIGPSEVTSSFTSGDPAFGELESTMESLSENNPEGGAWLATASLSNSTTAPISSEHIDSASGEIMEGPQEGYVDDLVALATDPRTAYVYWELRPVRFARVRWRDPSGALMLRVLTVAPGQEETEAQTQDLPIERLAGDCFLRGLPPGAELRLCVGWLGKKGFTPLVVAPEMQMPREILALSSHAPELQLHDALRSVDGITLNGLSKDTLVSGAPPKERSGSGALPGSAPSTRMATWPSAGSSARWSGTTESPRVAYLAGSSSRGAGGRGAPRAGGSSELYGGSS